ncbi:adhesion G-protein coupled receptor G2 [Aplysia californica]|uniref:Adhesion G-protein coupled receptor G2 n=1 Tax=Aplysia californica TaxID=6500 RepID=A0ABM1VSW2_APLCA|nr:adhesion G-protein coupled receptor G2 [Aplysia californica]
METNRCRELTCARGKQLVDSRCESKVKVANGLAYEVSLTLTGAVSEKQTAKMTQDIFPGTDRDSDVNEISQQVKGHFLFLLFNKTFRDFSSDTLLTYGKSHNFSETTTTTTTTTTTNNNNNSTTTTTTATKKTSTFSVSFYAKLLLQHSVVVQDFESKLLAITDNRTWTINVNGVPLDLWSSYNIPPAGQLLKNLAPPNDVTYRPVKDGVSPLPASPNVEPTHYYYYHNSPYSPNSRNFPARNRFDLSFNDETTSDDNTGDDDDEKEGMAFILVKRALQCPRLTFNLSESAEVELIAVNSSADEKGGQTTTTYELRHTGSGETFSLQDFYMSEERGETSVVVYLCADAFLKYLPTVKTTNNVTSIDLFGVGLVVTSYVCLGLSILTLSLTLLTYGLFASLRTLPGKATMGFSSTLLAAIILFLIGGFLDDVTVLCEVVGVATHFFLLSAFTWMVICTAHMYYVFTKLLEHKVAEHETKSRFLVYVLISFLIPAVIVSLTITCNSIYQASKDNDDNNSTDIRSDGDGNRFVTCDAPTDWIGYGAGICYLSNKLSLLLAGVLPIVLACVINLGVFFRAMMALRSMTSQQKLVRKEATNSLLIYVKLSSLTGLNWLPCMIAVFVSNVVLWYLFLILCGLQGVYVFAAFCLNKRVLALYRQRFEPRRSRKDAKKYARPATQGSEGKPDQRMLKEGTDSSTLTTLSSHLDSSESEGKPGRQKLVENTHI